VLGDVSSTEVTSLPSSVYWTYTWMVTAVLGASLGPPGISHGSRYVSVTFSSAFGGHWFWPKQVARVEARTAFF
jgi:hypothetical protein